MMPLLKPSKLMNRASRLCFIRRLWTLQQGRVLPMLYFRLILKKIQTSWMRVYPLDETSADPEMVTPYQILSGKPVEKVA